MSSLFSTPVGYSQIKAQRRQSKTPKKFGAGGRKMATPRLSSGKKRNYASHYASKATVIPLTNSQTKNKKNRTVNTDQKENFQEDPNSLQEIFGSVSNEEDPLGFAGVFGNEEERRNSTPHRRVHTPVKPESRRDSIFGLPLRVKPPTPNNKKKTSRVSEKRGITPIKGLSKRIQTPIEVIRKSRLSLNAFETLNTPLSSRKQNIPTPSLATSIKAPDLTPISVPEEIETINHPQMTNIMTSPESPKRIFPSLNEQVLPQNQTELFKQLMDIQEEENKLMNRLMELRKERDILLRSQIH